MADRTLSKIYSDRRWHDDPGATTVLCSACQRFLFEKSKELGKLVCTEYPEGIPDQFVDLIADEDKDPACYIPNKT